MQFIRIAKVRNDTLKKKLLFYKKDKKTYFLPKKDQKNSKIPQKTLEMPQYKKG
jgi:hypothetical protein